MPWVAKRLGLIEPMPAKPAATLEITALGDVDAEIVEYTLSPASRAVNRRLARMALPEGVVVAMITRSDHVIPPRGSTVLQADDHLFVVVKHDFKPMVEQVFSEHGFVASNLPKDLRLKGASRVSDIEWCYELPFPNELGALTLEDLAKTILAEKLAEKAEFEIGPLSIRVEELVGDRVTTVTLMTKTAEV